MGDQVKVYCYFLESRNDLYAFTINKDYKERYEAQRCMERYYSYGVKTMSEIEYQLFSSKNSSLMLHTDFITSGNNTIEIIATPYESTRISDECEYISDFLITLRTIVTCERMDINLKPKYLNFIKDLTNLLMYDESTKEYYLNIDSFKLYSHLLKNTLYIKKEED